MNILRKISYSFLLLALGLFMSASPTLAATSNHGQMVAASHRAEVSTTNNHGSEVRANTHGADVSAANSKKVPTPSTDNSHEIITETNSADGNSLLVYDSNLNLKWTIPTGGTGTGAGLGSQGALAMAANGHRIIAVNAGDNTVSSFVVGQDGKPVLVDTVSSHGTTPVSATIYEEAVYVLNAGDNTIAGFISDDNGNLSFIDGSLKTLSGTGPAEIAFDPSGEALAVTEKTSNQIEVFGIDEDTYLETGSSTTPSSGHTPFGFQFKGHNLVVSEALDGAGSALSTYRLNHDDTLTPVSQSVMAPDQVAACWVETSRDGQYAYITNTGTNSISSYSHGANTQVTLLNAEAATTSAGPIDMTKTDTTLYVLTGSEIMPFTINGDGSLTSAGSSASITGAVGLVAVR